MAAAHMLTYVPVRVPGAEAGAIELYESLTQERAAVRGVLFRTALTMLALLTLCVALTFGFGALLVAKPMRALVAKAERIGSGDLSGSLDQRPSLTSVASRGVVAVLSTVVSRHGIGLAHPGAMLSPILGRTRRLLCVVGRDVASVTALERARQWQLAWGCDVRVLLVVAEDTARQRTIDSVALHRWLVSKAGLDIAVRDVTVCSTPGFSAALRQATSTRVDFVLCAAAPDAAADISEVPIRALWSAAAQLGATFIAARPAVRPARALVITDGSLRTVPVLELALGLGERMDTQLTYVNGLRIAVTAPSGSPRRFCAPADLQPATLQPSALLGAGSAQAYSRASIALASAMTHAGVTERTDVVLVGLPAEDVRSIDELVRVAPCTLIAVACGTGAQPGRSPGTRSRAH